MATIDKRISQDGKTTFRVRTRLKGCAPQTASFSSITRAKRWAAATESALREGRYFATNEAKHHTLEELIERYERDVLPHKPKNARNQLVQLNWWKEQLGYCCLADVTPARIAECRDRLLRTETPKGKDRSPATVVRYLAALSHVFSVAMREWGWVNDNPLRKVTKPKEALGRVRCLTDDQRGRLLRACSASASTLLYPIVVLAMSTGMRQGEIVSLRWCDVDLVRDRITLHETKNGERRSVPLVSLALKLIRDLHKARREDTDLVFPSPTLPKPLLITKAWNTALAKAGIEDFRFHDLRHCAASYMVMNGASLAEVADVLGHKSVQTTRRYAHFLEGHSKRIVATMNEQIFG